MNSEIIRLLPEVIKPPPAKYLNISVSNVPLVFKGYKNIEEKREQLAMDWRGSIQAEAYKE